MQDTFEDWMRRANMLMKFGILPYILTENKSMPVHLVGTLVSVVWFVITLPIQILLLVPAIFCALMAIRHMRG